MSDTPDNRQSDPAEPRHEHSITAALEMFARGQLTRDQVGELVRRRSRPRGESVQRRWVHDEPYLAAHVVQGQQVLLGTTLCSMAAQLASEEFGVRNLVLVEPVVVPPGASVDVVVQRDDADVSKLVGRFSISGRAQRVTMTAELGDMDDGGRATEPMVVDTFTGTSDRTLSADEIRAVPLLSRAPVLDCVSRVWIRGDEALGRLQLRPEAIAAEGELAVHPALLDGGFVVGGTLVDPAVLTPSDGSTWVTMAVRAMRGTGSTLPNACWCRASSVRVTDQLITMDLRFHDDEGRCVLEVDGMTLRRIGGAPTSAQPTEATGAAPEPPSRASDASDATVRRYVTGVVQRTLGTGEVLDDQVSFMELGADSAQMIAMTGVLEDALGLELYPTLFFEYPTIAELSAALVAQHGEALSARLGALTDATRDEPAPAPSGPAPAVVPERNRDIAIVGMDGRFPGSPDLWTFWEHLRASDDLITEVPAERWNWRDWYSPEPGAPNRSRSRWGGFIEADKFDAGFFGVAPREALWLDPQLRVLLEVVHGTLQDAGCADLLRGTTTGFYLGVAFHEYWDEILRSGVEFTDYQAVSCVPSALSGRLSYIFDFRGPSVPVDNACASSLTALHLAVASLRAGECRQAVVAGTNLLISPLHYVYTSRVGALSPTGRCRSFDAAADGYVPGEGVASVLLKPLDLALADGDRIHAVIKGTATNHNGRANSPTAPSPEAQVAVLHEAWVDAGVDPSTLGYVEAHGTGTLLGDPIETKSLVTARREVAGEDSSFDCVIGSVKSHVGHLEACAGLAGLIKVILSMQHGEIPAMPNHSTQNPYLEIEDSGLRINDHLEEWPRRTGTPRRAGVSSFGMSGNNTHIVVEEYSHPGEVDRAGALILPLSARTEPQLREMAGLLAGHLAKRRSTVSDTAHTLQTGRATMASRAAFVVVDVNDAVTQLEAFARGGQFPAHAVRADPRHDAARRFEEGEPVEWNALGPSGGVTSLPPYPFARDRYWFTDVLGDSTRSATATSRASVVREDDEVHYRVHLTRQDFVVRDHVVKGDNIVPGAAHLDLALRASEAGFPELRAGTISDVTWAAPIMASEGAEVHVVVRKESDTRASFTIGCLEGDNEKVCSSGRLEYGSGRGTQEFLDVSSVIQHCPDLRLGEECYDEFSRTGLAYGPSFRSITRLHRGDGQALARLELSDDLRDSVHDWPLHPSLLDAALQTISGVVVGSEAPVEETVRPLYLPFRIGRIERYAALDDRMWVRAQRSTSAARSDQIRFDLDIADDQGRVLIVIRDFELRRVGIGVVGLVEDWVDCASPVAGHLAGQTVLVVGEGRQDEVVRRVTSAGGEVAQVVLPDAAADAYAASARASREPDLVLWMGGSNRRCVMDLTALVGAVHRVAGTLRLVFLSGQEQSIMSMWDKPVGAWAHSVALEWSGFSARVVMATDPVAALAGELAAAVTTSGVQEVRVGPEGCRSPRIREIPLDWTLHETPILAGKVYLVSGGTGGVGRHLVDWIVAAGGHAVVLSRSGASPEWLAQVAGPVTSIKVDVTDRGALAEALARARTLGPIRGVLHAAGVLNDSLTWEKSPGDVEAVVAAKAVGAVCLDELTSDDPLDFFVVFSSVAGLRGNLGQSDYAYANRAVDEFMVWRSRHAGHPGTSLSIEWPLWKDGGMQIDPATERFMRQTGGLSPLGTGEGLTILANLIHDAPHPVISIVKGDHSKIAGRFFADQTARLPDGDVRTQDGPGGTVRRGHPADRPSNVDQVAQPAHDAETDRVRYLLGSDLARGVATTLGLADQDVDLGAELVEFGFDSITFTELASWLNNLWGLELLPSVFYDHTTLRSLVDFVADEFGSEVATQRGWAVSVPETPGTKPDAPSVPAEPTDPGPAEKGSQRTSDRDDAHPLATATPQVAATIRIDESDDAPEPIAIVGMAGLFPGGDTEEFWRRVRAGEVMTGEVPAWRWDWREWQGSGDDEANGVRFGGFAPGVENFDCQFFGVSPGEAELMDPQQRIFMQTVWAAVEDSGHRMSEFARTNMCLFVGVGGFDYSELLRASGAGVGAHTATGSAHSLLANRISFLYDLRGTSEPIDTACSASLVAMHRAAQALRAHESDAAIAGGVNVLCSPTGFIAFSQAGMLASDGVCKSFSADADGYVRGEGVGAVVLKRLSDAEADHDHVYALIRGSAIGHGGRGVSLTAPSAQSQADIIEAAWDQADVSITSADYIETHGTGTRLGDPVEIKGLVEAFNRHHAAPGTGCALGSVKANVGHLETAAGMASLTKVLLSLRDGVIAPQSNLRAVSPLLNLGPTPFSISSELRPWPTHADGSPRRAGISSFGYGGINAHIVLEEHRQPVPAVSSGRPQVVTLSAKTMDALERQGRALLAHLERNRRSVPVETQTRLKEVSRLVADIAQVDPSDIDTHEDLGEIGLDPVDMATLCTRVSDKYQIPGDLVTAGRCRTVSEFVDVIGSGLGADSALAELTRAPVDFDGLAYTLQTGREPFAHRLAIVAGSVEELHDLLGRHLDGERSLPGVWTGDVSAVQDLTGLLLTGAEGDAYQRELRESHAPDKLARLWVGGINLDWDRLWDGVRPLRVSLPTYPFEPRRCWLDATIHRVDLEPRGKYARPGASHTASQPEPPTPKPAPSDVVTDRREEAPRRTTLARVQRLLARVLGWDSSEIHPEATFEELGFTSVLVKEANEAFAAEFGALPATMLFEFKTAGALADYVDRHLVPVHAEVDEDVREDTVKGSGDPASEAATMSQRPLLGEDRRPLAIVGMSGRYPMADDLSEFWTNLVDGRDCVSPIPADRPGWEKYEEVARQRLGEESYPSWGGFIDGYDAFEPEFFNISPLEARFLDPQERLFIETAWQCIEDSGHTPETITRGAAGDSRGRVGVFVGATYNNYQMYAASQLEHGDWLPVNSQTFSLANRVSYLMNFAGPSLTVDTACSSSLSAIHLACAAIRRKECDAAIAGGVNLTLHPSKYVTLAESGFIAGDGRCHSFGEGGDGYVPAEGVGAVLIKPLSQALEDGDHVYATILGSAINHDGHTFGYSVPNPVAQTEVISAALADASVTSDTISYVEAHGTGTSLGDPLEIRGLVGALGDANDRPSRCAIGSVKSNIGHAEAAAGIAQMHKVVLQLTHAQMVPTLIHSDNLNPNIDFDSAGFTVQRSLGPWPIAGRGGRRRAGVSSFGAGGVNVHVIVEGAPKPVEDRRLRGDGPVVLVLSARTPSALRSAALRLAEHLRGVEPSEGDLSSIAWTLQDGRRSLKHRLALLTSDPKAAAETLESFAREGRESNDLRVTEVGSPRSGAGDGGPRDPDTDREESARGLASDLAGRWLRGEEPDWRQLYPHGTPGRVPLPTYPFERASYWIVDPFDASRPSGSEPTAPAPPVPHAEAVSTPGASSDIGTGLKGELLDATEGERGQILTMYLGEKVAELLEMPDPSHVDGRSGFFEMGMDSVLATRLVNQVELDLGIVLHANAMFDHPTIEELAAELSRTWSSAAAPLEEGRDELADDSALERVIYTANWVTSEVAAPNHDLPKGPLVILDADDAVREYILARGMWPGQPVVLVLAGDSYARCDQSTFRIGRDEPDDLRRLFDDLGTMPDVILDLRPTRTVHADGAEGECSFPAFHLVQAVVRSRPTRPVDIVYAHVFDGTPDPVHEGFGGFGRAVRHESPNVVVRTLGLETAHVDDRVSFIAEACLRELGGDSAEHEVRYRWGQRWTRSLRQTNVAESSSSEIRLDGGGTCVITGGAGGLGRIVARHLVNLGVKRLVLTGRSAQDGRHVTQIEELRRLGAEASYESIDVTDRAAVSSLMQSVRNRGPITGVIHAAGVLDDGMLLTRTAQQMHTVIDPKLAGALNLDAATSEDRLDFFVVFSSMASVGGNPGQTDYAFANRFLGSFAAAREELRIDGRRHGLSRALIWPTWRDGGMELDEQTRETMRRRLGIAQLTTGSGLRTFDAALAGDAAEVGVVVADMEQLSALLPIERAQETPPSQAQSELAELLDELDSGW